VDAAVRECVHRRREHLKRLEEVERDDRLHDVELELPRFSGEGDGEIVPYDLERHLVDHLGDDGVDLARHDR